MLLIHGTGTDSRWFDSAANVLAGAFRVIAYDRRGWGRSEPIGDYTRTSIAEQAIEAGGLLKRLGPGRATVLGVGFGAVVALELALSEPGLVTGAVAVEPPLLGTVTAATEGMSADVSAIRDAAAAGGKEAAYELFLAGGLPTLGSGADRLGPDADRGPSAAHTFLVELPAIPAWPLDPARLAGLEADVTVATLPSTPALLATAADQVAPRIPAARRVRTVRDGQSAIPELLLEDL